MEESDKRMRATRNLEMLLHDLILKGPNPYMYFQLGQNYLSLNDLEKAAHYYKLGLELNTDPSSDFARNMTEAYGYCLMNLAKYDDAMTLKEYYDQFSDRADFIYLMGILHMKKGEPEKAIAEFEKATKLQTPSRKGVNSYRAFFQIADIYESMGDFEKARIYYKKCGDFEPAMRRLKELAAQSAS